MRPSAMLHLQETTRSLLTSSPTRGLAPSRRATQRARQRCAPARARAEWGGRGGPGYRGSSSSSSSGYDRDEVDVLRERLAGQQLRWQRSAQKGSWGGLVVPGLLAITAATTLTFLGGSLLLGLAALPLTLALSLFGGVVGLALLPLTLLGGVAATAVAAAGFLLGLVPVALLGGAGFYLLRNMLVSQSSQGGRKRAQRDRNGVFEVEVEDTEEEDSVKRLAYDELADFDKELRRREARRQSY